MSIFRFVNFPFFVFSNGFPTRPMDESQERQKDHGFKLSLWDSSNGSFIELIHIETARSSPLQADEYTSTTHAGTHMDAPSHLVYGGKTIDQLPIESFIAPAAVIDITSRAAQDPDAGVTIDDLQNWEAQTGHSLDGTVVLLRSGWGSRYYDREAYYGTSTDDVTQMHFPGLEEDAAQWLVDNRTIVGIGTDTLSFDKGNSLDLNSHKILLGRGIYGLENIANLEQIPIYGATLYILPMKIAEASGAPTRIIATFPKVIFHSG